jgi:hypothetical protein
LTLAEWLIEEGIGEDRAALIEDDRIVAARLHWPGGLTLGQVEDAQVVKMNPRGQGTRTALVRFANGQEAFASRLPQETTEGMRVRQTITREAISERGRLKLAQSTFTEDAPTSAPSLKQQLENEGETAKIVQRFPAEADWDELFLEAWSGDVAYKGGALILSDTPAMTLIDVDLHDYPDALYFNGVPVIARTLRRMNIGGNIGIDFPTLDKSDRRAIDARLDKFLADWPHEKTAMNGFGFVQIVAALRQPSILQRIGRNRSAAAARFLLRKAEQVAEPGTLLLVAHPAVIGAMEPAWLDELSRRTGRQLRTEANASLALEAGFAQAVAS